MPKLLELPISGRMKEKFESFLNIIENHQLHYRDCVTAAQIKLGDYAPYVTQPICSICGHPLQNIYIYDDTTSSHQYGLGAVCAANLEAIQTHGLDKLNYKREVKLIQKTLIKRMIEKQVRNNRITIAIKHPEEIEWLYNFMAEIEDIFNDFYWQNQHNSPEGIVWRKHIEFYWSLYNQLERKGTLTEKQIQCLTRAKHEGNHITRIKAELTRERKKAEEKAIMDRRYSIALNLHDKWGVSNRDREFLRSIKKFYEEKGYLTEKQMAVVDKIYEEYQERRR